MLVFAAAMAMYPWRIHQRALFEALISVVLAAATTALMTVYLRGVKASFVKHGILCGLVWIAVNLALDTAAFLFGPMKMSLGAYLQDIGATYLMIPVITVGLAHQRAITFGARSLDARVGS